MRGENNPFWGRAHDAETLERIRATKFSRPPQRKGGPSKGYKHTPEARAKITAALRQRWIDHRDKMLSSLPRGEDHHYHKPAEERRYRKEWSPLQRKTLMKENCMWCGSTERLNLDHIIPVLDGGLPENWNAQTLCHPCNLWKVKYVDRPRYLARLRGEGKISVPEGG